MDERIHARAHILQVIEQCVHIAHHGLGRAPRLAIQAVNRKPRVGIVIVLRLDHVVLLLCPGSVLWAEQGHQIHGLVAKEDIRGMAQVGKNRGRVDHRSHPGPLEQRETLT